jgi:hypothetical protein
MNPRICICCGEPIDEGGNILSRNPNVCASCSSLADGMAEPGAAGLAPALELVPACATSDKAIQDATDEVVLEWHAEDPAKKLHALARRPASARKVRAGAAG